MYSTSYSVADIGRAPNIQRGQRSLHGSQSHANFHSGVGGGGSSIGPGQSFNGMDMSQGGMMNGSQMGQSGSVGQGSGVGVGGGGGPSGGFVQAQPYMPGYLLAASQGQPPPAQTREFALPPLENEKSMKSRPSIYGRGFGEESLLSAPRPSPKGRSPRTPVSMDDENAPPTVSISESHWSLSDSQANAKSTSRQNSGGFHPLSRSHAPFTPSSSMSTTYENGTPGRDYENDNGATSSGLNGRGYSVTIFGFTPSERQQAIDNFITEDSEVKDDVGSMDDDGKYWKNWVEILYKYEQDAIRAVRKSGSVKLMGGCIIIGAKWTNAAQEFDAPMPSHARHQSLQTPASPGPGMSNSRSVRLKPSASAFRSNTIATSTAAPAQDADEFGLAAHANQQQARGGAPQETILGRVSSMMFGGWQ